MRSSCSIKDKEHKHVLLTNMRAIKEHEVFLLPGGRLEILESSYDAVFREIKEELGFELEYKLISIEENIVKNTKFHMLEFVFYAEIDSFDNIKTPDNGWDKFKIVEIAKIDSVDIRPKTINKLIKKERYEEIVHHINYDWTD